MIYGIGQHLTRNVMQEAAELWAFARNNSYVAYDADLIIAAQAVIIKSIGIDVIKLFGI